MLFTYTSLTRHNSAFGFNSFAMGKKKAPHHLLRLMRYLPLSFLLSHVSHTLTAPMGKMWLSARTSRGATELLEGWAND